MHCFFADRGKRADFLLGIFRRENNWQQNQLTPQQQIYLLNLLLKKQKQKQMSASLIFYFYYPFKPGAIGRTKSDLKWQAF